MLDKIHLHTLRHIKHRTTHDMAWHGMAQTHIFKHIDELSEWDKSLQKKNSFQFWLVFVKRNCAIKKTHAHLTNIWFVSTCASNLMDVCIRIGVYFEWMNAWMSVCSSTLCVPTFVCICILYVFVWKCPTAPPSKTLCQITSKSNIVSLRKSFHTNEYIFCPHTYTLYSSVSVSNWELHSIASET